MGGIPERRLNQVGESRRLIAGNLNQRGWQLSSAYRRDLLRGDAGGADVPPGRPFADLRFALRSGPDVGVLFDNC